MYKHQECSVFLNQQDTIESELCSFPGTSPRSRVQGQYLCMRSGLKDKLPRLDQRLVTRMYHDPVFLYHQVGKVEYQFHGNWGMRETYDHTIILAETIELITPSGRSHGRSLWTE